MVYGIVENRSTDNIARQRGNPKENDPQITPITQIRTRWSSSLFLCVVRTVPGRGWVRSSVWTPGPIPLCGTVLTTQKPPATLGLRQRRHLAMLEAIATEHRTSLGGSERQRGLFAALRAGRQGFVFHETALSAALPQAQVALDLATLAAPRLIDQVLQLEEPLLSRGEHKFFAALYAG